jgi:hypothetical protein
MPGFNCTCNDDTTGFDTLDTLRNRLMVRLGFAAQLAAPPPGMPELLTSFLQEAQVLIYARHPSARTERIFTWTMAAGERHYDLPANREQSPSNPEGTCTRRLNPDRVTWVGVERGSRWYALQHGINPALYTSDRQGWPERYEIRQCIEVWPVPSDSTMLLRVKGHFGLDPFTAGTDRTTIDSTLVFLLALANAKAHYGQPDAGNYVTQFERHLGELTAGTHRTARYIPGILPRHQAVEPVWEPLP